MANPSDHNPTVVGFRISDTEFRVFQVSGLEVPASHKVTIDGSKKVCSCLIARMTPGVACQHVECVTRSSDQVVTKTGLKTDTGFASLSSSSSITMEMSIFDQKTKKLIIVPMGLGDISAYSLIHLLTHGPTKGITDATGNFKPERIYDELDSCNIKKNKLIDNIGAYTPKPKEVKPAKPPITISSRPKPLWETTKRPDPDKFYVEKDTWTQILYCLCEGVNVLLTGPSGTGKSSIVYVAAEALGKKVAAFNMGAMSEPRSSLIGNVHFDKEKGTMFYKSRFVEAVEDTKNEGHTVLLDELTRAEPAAFNILLPLLDDQGYLSLDESEDNTVITKNPKTAFVATANIGMEYTGTMAMDTAIKNRFGVIIDIGFPPEDAEKKVLVGRCPGLKPSQAERLVKIANEQRKMANDGEFVEKVSTRQLIQAGKQIGLGVEPNMAINFCILNSFSNDGGEAGERTQFKHILQKFR